MTEHYDLIIIGGGSAGLTVACTDASIASSPISARKAARASSCHASTSEGFVA